MPAPVASWVFDTFPTAKSLNIACYTCDGTQDNPNGIFFHSYRPILFESYNRTAAFPGASGGTQSTMATSGTVTTSVMVYDTAGYFGQTQDQPATGYYQFLPAVRGSAGDGQTAGGWTLLAHFAALKTTGTQTSASADLLGTAQPAVSGTRQPPGGTLDSCPFFLDLVNPGNITWSPAVTIRDSAGSSATSVVNATDTSGETCRFYGVWAAVSSASAGLAVFSPAGTYPWTAPAGVTVVTASPIAGGAGGGAGNSSGGGIEFGGGGGGGGESASGDVGVTPANNYTVVVGPGGPGGTAPGGNGTSGGASLFAGDTTNVTAHGGSAGAGATTGANGAAGAGGTGSGATTHFDGGAGAAGKTASYGGGGGSSAGTASAGTSATGPAGAPAPAGGGPGGGGGSATIGVVQSASGSASSNSLTLKFKNAVQAGNAVIAAVIYQGKPSAVNGSFPDPTVTLSDGTLLNSTASADLTSIATNMQTGLFDVFSVTGGQAGIIVTGHASTAQGDYRAIAVQMWEVTGLGPSPSSDASSSAEVGGGVLNTKSYPPSGTTPPTTAQAPEFWVGVAGGQLNNSVHFNINAPASSQGWTCFPSATTVQKQDIISAVLAGYQVATTTGTVKFSGSYSKSVSCGWIAASYSTSATTAGAPPITGPGGGGGGGLGNSADGGAGFDGQVTLAWTGISGSGYGTPDVPAPFATWAADTSIGTSAIADVDLNGPTGIRDVLNFLSNPPLLRVGATIAQSITSATLTNVTFAATAATVDSYSGWSSGTYTVPRDGLYLFHGLVAFAANASGNRRAGATINGTTYWGPPSPATSSGGVNVAKTQIFSLQAGDTVQLACRQTSGNPLALSTTDQTRFLLTWLTEAGVPPSLWTPPDTTFRWASGTKGENLGGGLAAEFSQHLGNDLGFLCQRPSLMAYQATAQTGLTTGAFSTVTLDTVAGLIHGTDSGDNYAGWTAGGANNYTAQVPGWYLTVGEFFTAAATTSVATVTAAILPDTSGGATPSRTPDYYQAASATTTAGTGGGAAVFGLHYMLAGETITPQVMGAGAGYGASYSTQAGLQNGGFFYPHLECVWISE
jgi:hypothetical protein